MRVHVVHAHPVETSYNRALFHAVVETLQARGHEVDALNLYEEGFEAPLSREERLTYHDVPDNLTPAVQPYVDRLMAAEAIIFVHPVWNFGYPAILKGYFDRVYLPGVAFLIEGGGDRGRLIPNLTHIRKVAFVTTYGSTRWQAMVIGDPPRRLAHRWAWVTFGTRWPPKYLALHGINHATQAQLDGFIGKVRREIGKF